MAGLLDEFIGAYSGLADRTRQQTADYLLSQGVDPEIARSRADAVASKINRNQGIAEFLTPQSMVDVGLMAATGPFGGPGARAVVGGLLAASDVDEAMAKVTGGVETVKKAGSKIKQTVIDPIRNAFPGIYANPKEIAKEAAARVAPEHPALKQLFGVTRDDLYEISKQGTREGNMVPDLAFAANARGSDAATRVMTPQNARRLVDTLGEALKYPELVRGMVPWYVMDPAFDMTRRLVGPDEAKRLYGNLNTSMGSHSPASDVLTEINRGTAANMMNTAGRYDEWVKYGGRPTQRGAPPELSAVLGHPYHSTSMAPPLGRYFETGQYTTSTPKVPTYIPASGVPEIGFQTKFPVPDAHYTRAVGIPDVRGSKDYAVSMSMPEYQQFYPWYNKKVAQPLGIEPVPTQALQWGTFGHATGVDTAIGAGKLELLAQRISEEAARRGVNPFDYRDKVLRGQAHASWMLPTLGAGAAGILGGADDQ